MGIPLRLLGGGGDDIEEALAGFQAHLRLAGRSARYCRDVYRQVLWIAGAAGVEELSALDIEAATRGLDRLLADGRSRTTLDHYRVALRSFGAWLVRVGRVRRNPWRDIPRIARTSERSFRRRALTDAELSRLFAVADEKGRGLFYRVAALSGLRRGELERLRWEEIDLESGVLTVARGKSGRTEHLPLHPQLWSELAQVPPADRAGPVFSPPPSNKTRRRDFDAAGIPTTDERGRRADLHAMRSTLGRRLADAGVPIDVTRALLRHSKIETTAEFYLDSTLERSRDAIGRIQLPEDDRGE